MEYIVRARTPSGGHSSNATLYWGGIRKLWTQNESSAKIFNSEEDAKEDEWEYKNAYLDRFTKVNEYDVDNYIFIVKKNSKDESSATGLDGFKRVMRENGFSLRGENDAPGANRIQFYRRIGNKDILFYANNTKTNSPYVYLALNGGDRKVFNTPDELEKFIKKTFPSLSPRTDMSNDADLRSIKRSIHKYAEQHKLDNNELNKIISSILKEVVEERSQTLDDNFDWNY